MIRCDVLTFWTDAYGLLITDVALRYPGAWSDATGITDAPSAPDGISVVFRGLVDDETFAALQTDAAVTVLEHVVI